MEPHKKRRKTTAPPEFTHPLEALSREGPSDKFDITLVWSTLDTQVANILKNIALKDPTAVDCRTKILNHLTTNDIMVFDGAGNMTILEKGFNTLFQKYYKKFVKDAFLTNLIYGVIPFVLKVDESGFFFPVVLKLGTYVIQTAYMIEREEQVYRVIRPIEFCCQPQNLKWYSATHNLAFLTTGIEYGGVTNFGANMTGISIQPNPFAGKDIGTSGIGNKGWFIDTSVTVMDLFGKEPGACGEIQSPLISVVELYNLTNCMANFMIMAEDKKLKTHVVLEKRPETNTEVHYDKSGIYNPHHPLNKTVNFNGMPTSSDSGTGERLNMGLSDILLPIPDINMMTTEQVRILQQNKRALGSTSSFNSERAAQLLGAGYLADYMKKLHTAGAIGESEMSVRYCPQGYQVSTFNKHPEIHAGERFAEMRDLLNKVIASAMQVPYSLMYPHANEAATTDANQLKMFQRSISQIAFELNRQMTHIFRESFSSNIGKIRSFSIKTYQPDFSQIDAANYRNPERYAESRNRSGGKVGIDFQSTSRKNIAEMLPRMWVVPTISSEYMSKIIKKRKPQKSVVTTDEPGHIVDESFPKPDDKVFETRDEGEVDISKKFSGKPIAALADVHNFGLGKKVDELEKETNKVYGKQTILEEMDDQEKPVETSDKDVKKKKDSTSVKSKYEPIDDINDLTIRLDPINYVTDETLLSLFKCGALPIEHLQRIWIQSSGVTEPMIYKGTEGVIANAEHNWIMEGGLIARALEEKINEQAFERDTAMLGMQHENQIQSMKISSKLAPKTPGQSGGSSSSSSSSSGGGSGGGGVSSSASQTTNLSQPKTKTTSEEVLGRMKAKIPSKKKGAAPKSLAKK